MILKEWLQFVTAIPFLLQSAINYLLQRINLNTSHRSTEFSRPSIKLFSGRADTLQVTQSLELNRVMEILKPCFDGLYGT